jgi:hypothetical protein
MGRVVLYSILGFIIFGISGLLIVIPFSPGESSPDLAVAHIAAVQIGHVAGLIALIGAILGALLASWMNVRGEAKLETFSKRPTMMYSLRGAVIGLWIGLLGSMWPLDTIDPGDRYAAFYIVGTGLCVVAGAYLGTYLARRYNLPADTPPLYGQVSDVLKMTDEKQNFREKQADS